MSVGRQYRVKATLGRGAFGDVFLAETVGTGIARTVAIKVLHADRATVPALLARLRDEARMLALLKHRAIVAVDDLVELDGAWTIVMEYVEGADVAELLHAGPIPAVAALSIAEEVAHALHAATTTPGPDGTPLRLVHRDVKPSNIRVTAHGDVKLLDFGVARADFGEREGATVDAALGTIAYMAPERFAGNDTPSGDVYALGVTLFEMLTGVKPGKSATDADRAPPGRGCAAQWTWLKQASPALHDLLANMLSPDMGKRPAARDLARQLAAIRLGIEGPALDEWAEETIPPMLVEGAKAKQVDSRSGSVMIERTQTTELPREGGGVLGMAVAGSAAGVLVFGGLLLLTIGVAIFYWWQNSYTPEAEAPKAAVVEPKPVEPKAVEPTPAEPAAVEVAPAVMEPTPTPVAPVVSPAAETAPGRATKDPVPAKEPAPVKEKAVAPVPAKVEEPKPVEAAVSTDKGRLSVTGDATSVVLRGAGGTARPGDIAPGTWTAEVTFADGRSVSVRDVQILGGKTTTLKCSAAFLSCRVIGP